MAILTINDSIELPDPSAMTIILQDIDASTTTRNAAGTLIRDRVCGAGEAKRKLNCEWSGITMDEACRMMQAIGDVFFSITYPDTYTGEIRTGTFYVGDRTCKIYKVDADGENAIMESITADFIEQ